ncbi:MAG TPA: glutaredoxin domain-containing protein, partial [Saprospiraceae bacterium]|nr:glutaredoxin domain-containing protein [Saprospiraceae bacterium]
HITMKFNFFLSLFILAGFVASAQQQDISVFEQKKGDKNIIIARNIGKVSYLVTLDIHESGMEVTPGIKAQGVVPPGKMMQLATLTPKPGMAWTYGYDVSYEEFSGSSLPVSPPAPEVHEIPISKDSTLASIDSLIVFFKPGCSRCTSFRQMLHDKGITFTEVDMSSDNPAINQMWLDLQKQGFNGGTLRWPLVKKDGHLYWDIIDMNAFIEELQH